MQEQMKVNSSILERFEFRDIRQEEANQAVLIEKICFPPNEACTSHFGGFFPLIFVGTGSY